MKEVAFAGEDHGDAVLVGGGDHLVVAQAAADEHGIAMVLTGERHFLH